MNARIATWYEDEQPAEIGRWALVGTVVVALHLLVLSPYVFYHPELQLGDDTSPISLDLSPSNDTVDKAEVLPTPDPTPQVEQPPPDPQPPPPPPQPQAIVETPPPPPPKVEEQQPSAQEQQASTKGGAPRVPPSWLTAFTRHIQKFKRYPSAGIKRSQQGKVEVSFTVDRNGHVLSREVARSSGYPSLDKEALALLDRAQPFPPFTPNMKDDQLTLTFPLLFDLYAD